MRATRTHEATLVTSAQAGDLRARDELVASYLPLVYTIVRRALDDDPDADDVVQDIVVRALRQLPALRSPANFRPWLTAIALRQIGTHLRRSDRAADRTTALGDLDPADPDLPSENATLLQVELSTQRRQVRRAARWLDPDDRAVLPLWWLQTADVLSRTEMAEALGVSVAHAGVRVQRLRAQLELCRQVVAAVEVRPRCDRLDDVLDGWDGRPSPLWRKRIARHLRTCPVCGRATAGMVPAERLLPAVALLPVPAGLAAVVLSPAVLSGAAVGAAAAGLAGAGAGAGVGVQAGLLGQIALHPVITAVAAGTLAVGGTVTATQLGDPEPPPRAAPAPATAPATAGATATTTAAPAQRATTPPLALRTGRLSLESADRPGRYVAVADDDLGVLARPGDAATRIRSTWTVVAGLADADCFSFRAPDGQHLRHIEWRVRLHPDNGSALYRSDATFCPRPGDAPGSIELESWNYPGWFLRHDGDELWVRQSDDSAAFRAGSAFRVRPPLAR